MCKAYNNAVAAIQADHPDRFIATAILPFDDLEESCREARRSVRELGVSGIQIPANWMGRNFDDMELYPFLEHHQRAGRPHIRPPYPPELLRLLC